VSFVRCLATAVVLLAPTSIASPAHAAPQSCGEACARETRACLRSLKADERVAKHACQLSGDPDCRRQVIDLHRSGKLDCKTRRDTVCRPCCDAGGIPGINACARAHGQQIPEDDPQDPGDATAGRATLLGGDFMTCGVPFKLWETPALRPLIAQGFGGKSTDPAIPDRTGHNDGLPYFLTAFTTPEGVDVLNANCLLCHGGQFDGQVMIGLGNPTRDFTAGAGGGSGLPPLTDDLLNFYGLNDAEKAEVRKLFARGDIVAPKTVVRTVGQNPAEMLAAILMAHHDRDTLAWSDDPVVDFVVRDENGDEIAEPIVTSDPPPWWRAHKKNGLFYNGMARGQHRGTMAAATSVCVDSIPRAQEVDAMFKDINAFIMSLRAPTYPRGIDAALAAEGRQVFLDNCATCHGTYGVDDDHDFYPNLLIPLDVIGTDPVVANAGVVHTPELVDWYNLSFYGAITPLVPNDPFPGYMPPPLDGIWATAPYLHNGSVPTLALLLNSGDRPTYWRRNDYDSTHFDEESVGWPWTTITVPQAEAPPGIQKFVYDTTYWSQSNKGHRFGDHLRKRERRAVIEYLKTL
jgi:RoxA-like, cytochrome c-like